jgi:predicted homoserine dehydrogenase-like protein
MAIATTLGGGTSSFAINGIGAMGRGLAHQMVRVSHTGLVGLSDIDIARAQTCANWLGLDHETVTTPKEAEAAIARGKVAVAGDGRILAACSKGNIFFEASSAVAEVADGVLAAIDNGKHVIMMNSEADLAFAPLFARRAAEAGVIYSSADGDQYGVIKRLADQISAWGFDLVMFGNIKGFLDRRANPTSIIPEADIRNLDYRMCAAYTDGTKLNIEMAILANVFDARAARPGMSGPRARSVTEVPSLFALAKMWDGGVPLVDYILGAEPGGGIFVIGHSADAYARDMMRYYKMGEGPFYVFYRPYHLCHVEAVSAAIEAVRSRQPLMQPTRASSDVIAYAKVPIAAGTRLDGIGGYSCYGLIETQGADGGLPICLSGYARARRAFAQDERIALADVEIDDSHAFALFDAARRCRHH